MGLPKPYYEADGITLYCGDCRSILPYLPNVHLVLTDPPYHVGIQYGPDYDDSSKTDYEFFQWAKGWLPRCLRQADTVVVCTGQPMLCNYAKSWPWKWLLCWHKPAAMGRSPVGFCNWEPMAMWGKGSKEGCDFVKAMIVPDGAVDDHPCPKPLEWATGFISLFPDAQTILDPFCGSGTTLRAAMDLGRRAIGIEIEEKYCRIAVERLRQRVLITA